MYPTVDGKPPKTPQEKPKKPSKSDTKYQNPYSQASPASEQNTNNKFDFINYDDDILHQHTNTNAQHPGPGFFNPSASKTQYNDYDQYGGNGHGGAGPPPPQSKPNSPYHPSYNGQDQIHTQDKLPPELFNILGPNTHNIQPHLRIEQLLQHIQGGGGVDSNLGPALHGQNIHLPFGPGQQNGVNYQFGDHHHPELGSNVAPQRPTGGTIKTIFFF